MSEHSEFQKKFLAKYNVSPVWDYVGYVLGAIPFVWLANRHDSWAWLVVAVLQACVQYAIGYWLIEQEMAKERK